MPATQSFYVSPAMQDAITWLNNHNVRSRQMTIHHLKIGPINYYPGKGTIHVDDEPHCRPDTGHDALADVLRELRLLPNSPSPLRRIDL